jgi:hypothetical protein
VVGKSKHDESRPVRNIGGAHYAFTLDQIWDTGPQATQRIG